MGPRLRGSIISLIMLVKHAPYLPSISPAKRTSCKFAIWNTKASEKSFYQIPIFTIWVSCLTVWNCCFLICHDWVYVYNTDIFNTIINLCCELMNWIFYLNLKDNIIIVKSQKQILFLIYLISFIKAKAN